MKLVINSILVGVVMFLLFLTQLGWVTALYATGGTILFLCGIVGLAWILTKLFGRN